MSYRFGHNMLKPTYGLQKSWVGRKRGVMKKANEMSLFFGAKVALLIERDGVLYTYQSQDDFPNNLPGLVLTSNKMTPNDFITLAEVERRRNHAGSLSPPPSSLGPSAETTAPPPGMVTTRVDGPKPRAFRVAKGKGKGIQDRAYFTILGAKEEVE